MTDTKRLIRRLNTEQRRQIERALRAGSSDEDIRRLYEELTGEQITDDDGFAVVVWFRQRRGINDLREIQRQLEHTPPSALPAGRPRAALPPAVRGVSDAARELFGEIGIPRFDTNKRTVRIAADFIHPNGMQTRQQFVFEKNYDEEVSDAEFLQAVDDYQEQISKYPERLRRWIAEGGNTNELHRNTQGGLTGIGRDISDRDMPEHGVTGYRAAAEAAGMPHEQLKPILLTYRTLT